ncbi:dihydrodipicolinate synthase family protein [Schlesneria paludicola]|uniref:dihydrodipicolinate synthase family protein n=1 Tax=Schlesneria paludicola TaxID=360056 RepID=UPI00029A0205|nr:dihydrodipicolinate synthase family protein [Schlesneria paludicola]
MVRYPSCIMAGCVVPWNSDNQFMEDLFRDQVRKLIREGTQHLYIFGTAGEGYAVNTRQFIEITRAFQDEMHRENCKPMVGVINQSLSTIIERIEMARDLGVTRFQISLPNWGALADKEVAQFFRETCGRFPDCQFLHYNLLRTKRLITADEYARLAGDHENLVATKNSTDSMERIHALLTRVPQLQHFLTETGFVYGSLIGQCGLLISLASANWKSAREFFEAGQQRDAERLIANQMELNAMLHLLIKEGGPGDKIDGAFDKLLWRLHDERFPLRLLPPYEGLSDEAFLRFSEKLRTSFPRWAC